MIPFRMDPMGFSPWQRLVDQYTKFLVYGDLTDRAGGVPIVNHGLEWDGAEIYAPASNTAAYAAIPENALPSDVFTSTHDWTIEIDFTAPDGWQTAASGKDYCGIFGQAASAGLRFDILIQVSTGVLVIGSVLDDVGPIVTGRNHFTFQRAAADGTKIWELNGSRSGRLLGYDVGNIRTLYQPIMSQGNISANRHGYPFRIRYIRISNCLRLT